MQHFQTFWLSFVSLSINKNYLIQLPFKTT